MTHLSSEELFRQAAEAESGMPVSAGLRLAHIRLAVESGRAFYVDLSAVPEDKRPLVKAEIKELVNRFRTPSPSNHLGAAPNTSNVSA